MAGTKAVEMQLKTHSQPCRGALWWVVPLTLPWGKLRHHFQSELKATEAQVTAAPGYN